MKITVLRCAFLAAVMTAVSIPASAGELKLTMQDGRVTLMADNVPVRQILQEWARIGQTRILNADKLNGPNVTLQLVNTPERDALDIILRTASGYIAAPRVIPVAGGAVYDRITIFMSTTRPPAQLASANPPPTFQRPPQVDDSDEPINVTMPPGMMNPPSMNPGMINPVNGQYQPYPGMLPQPQPQPQQFQQMPNSSPVPGPLMSARPGALPQPQPTFPPGIPNPYQPQVVKPGGGGQ